LFSKVTQVLGINIELALYTPYSILSDIRLVLQCWYYMSNLKYERERNAILAKRGYSDFWMLGTPQIRAPYIHERQAESSQQMSHLMEGGDSDNRVHLSHPVTESSSMS
jgi:hypothetical protein